MLTILRFILRGEWILPEPYTYLKETETIKLKKQLGCTKGVGKTCVEDHLCVTKLKIKDIFRILDYKET